MFELLLSLCPLQLPVPCETRAGGLFETESACHASARDFVPEGRRVDAWSCDGDGLEFPVSEVSQGVFVHKGHHGEAGPENLGDLANSGFVIGRDAVAVIDPGGSAPVAERLLGAIRARTALPVRWVILTHMHPDHILGAHVFAEAGAEILGHPGLGAGLGPRFEHYVTAFARDIGPGFGAPPPVPQIVPAPERLDLGDRVLELIAHQTAHTPNDLTVRDLASDTWFLGDLLFLHHLPALDGSITGWIELLDRLSETPAAWVVPGHGPVRVAWPEAAAPQGRYLEKLARDVRAEIDAGTEMLDALETVSPADPAHWLMIETFHPRNVTAAFRALEWE